MKNSLKLLLIGLLFVYSSCTKTDSTPAFDVALGQTSLGQVLTGENGKTLYFFTSDISGQSQCTGNCLTNWPVFYKENPSLGTNLVASDFTAITRADGTKQTAYKGWPLYYYAADTKAGDIGGEKVGNIWFVAKPGYSLFFANAQLVGHDGLNYLSDYTVGTGKTIYLVDAAGRTLYGYAPDKKNTNTFTKSDFSNNAVWPVAEIAVPTDLPGNLSASDFTVIDVFGKKQLVFRGHPLYYFGQDNAVKGANKGISFPKAGVWPVYNSTTTPLQ
ncbi:MAG: hypothetical protein U0X91_16575 [Spirosomataceae bacterium]